MRSLIGQKPKETPQSNGRGPPHPMANSQRVPFSKGRGPSQPVVEESVCSNNRRLSRLMDFSTSGKGKLWTICNSNHIQSSRRTWTARAEKVRGTCER